MNSDKSTETYELANKLTKVGRHKKQCHIVLEHEHIDLIHFLIEDINAGHLQFTNNSKKDVFVNNERISNNKKCP